MSSPTSFRSPPSLLSTRFEGESLLVCHVWLPLTRNALAVLPLTPSPSSRRLKRAPRCSMSSAGRASRPRFAARPASAFQCILAIISMCVHSLEPNPDARADASTRRLLYGRHQSRDCPLPSPSPHPPRTSNARSSPPSPTSQTTSSRRKLRRRWRSSKLVIPPPSRRRRWRTARCRCLAGTTTD